MNCIGIPGIVTAFSSDEEYLDIASISTVFRSSWGTKPTTTRAIHEGTTPYLLQCAFDTGLKQTHENIEKISKLGRLDLFTSVRDNRWELLPIICQDAVVRNDLPLLKGLRDIDSSWALTFDVNSHRLNQDIRERYQNDYAGVCSIAALYGHFDILKWSRENGCPWDENVCYSAAISGNLEILKWARHHGCPWGTGTRVCANAAYGGHIDIIKWARSEGCSWDNSTTYSAATTGNFETVKWAHENGCKLDNRICYISAKNGNMEMFKWATDKKCPYEPEYRYGYMTDRKIYRHNGGDDEMVNSSLMGACADAALNGHLDILKFARSIGCPWTMNTCSNAALNGHLEVLKWARENGCPWDSMVCSEAAYNGHFETLQWARSQGCPMTWAVTANASHSGNIEMLQWARQNGCDWHDEACSEAAKMGHLDLIKWSFANGAILGHFVSRCAAENGHLDILKWVSEQGLPWGLHVCVLAAESGHLDILKWAVEKGLKLDEYVCMAAAKNGHLEIIKWIRSQKYEWDECHDGVTRVAIKGGHFDTFVWLFENGCPIPFNVYTVAAENGQLDILKYCMSKGIQFDIFDRICRTAAHGGHFPILKWAREHGCEWHTGVCSSLIRKGHMDMFNWARENGCPVGDIFEAAVYSGDIKLAKESFEDGREYGNQSMAKASRMGSLELVRFMISKGLPWTTNAYYAAKSGGHVEILKWIEDNSIEMVEVPEL